MMYQKWKVKDFVYWNELKIKIIYERDKTVHFSFYWENAKEIVIY